MRNALTFDGKLPESFLDAAELAREGALRYRQCRDCEISLYSPLAAQSAAGWRETQLSGMCEPCFDKLFAEPEGE